MPGLTNTLLGKQQKTFRLLSEDTALKSKEPVNTLDATNYPYAIFKAGQIVIVPNPSSYQTGYANYVSKLAVPSTAGAVAGKGLLGVAFETHDTTLDECAGSGLGTILWGPHEAQTQNYDKTGTYAKGQPLYASSVVNGNFTNSANGAIIAYCEAEDGTWLRYRWVGLGEA
jgi:hypothetical protein